MEAGGSVIEKRIVKNIFVKKNFCQEDFLKIKILARGCFKKSSLSGGMPTELVKY